MDLLTVVALILLLSRISRSVIRSDFFVGLRVGTLIIFTYSSFVALQYAWGVTGAARRRDERPSRVTRHACPENDHSLHRRVFWTCDFMWLFIVYLPVFLRLMHHRAAPAGTRPRQAIARSHTAGRCWTPRSPVARARPPLTLPSVRRYAASGRGHADADVPRHGHAGHAAAADDAAALPIARRATPRHAAPRRGRRSWHSHYDTIRPLDRLCVAAPC